MNKIFSGIRPSGKLHLGNYLGAIKNWLALSEAEGIDQTIFAVVDLHGITTPYDPKKFPDQVMDTVCDYLAAGVDPDKSLLIRQSHVPQHTELAWLLNTITPVSWLDRLPTYKEKLEQTPKYHNMGLLDYPVLMAADILLYKSTLVPVGEDQLPHIDLTNEIAKRFNSTFGNTFEPVKPYLTEGARIMSLQEPTKKMSKTGDDGIALSDSPDTIREKIKKAATDSGKEIKYDEQNKPGISNLLTIYHLLSNKEISVLESQYAGKSYVELKNDLAEVVVNFLKPHQEKYNDLRDNPDKVLKILEASEQKAREIAEKNLKEIKQKMGLG
ncbi:MAG: tryptophan--tRNA ligase [Candidatus Yanofskybacteria bacterium RIFCSPHIGHO2_01_FULL_44_22]|uniref:Tryptophan--tRNA ligase n=1 Tax=Candidatus Yanofskybacteria bacterium RIFCSPHIGHO2_01_FULL_44_22 TaxID=1802669 RepID=A0A1F8EUA9_9BACT|nr:MAG: tryptophan--tRNA ligase [Candidatus Yanofskybacteria bacterium RIFCSPHIGHO2_01_FULL_44_22]OGN08941.1 MAG: tryptophan--tRNA ligase [Candidatus Yanofskybacteria bacterium RIFCSPHIGHO2_02_FULL_41_12]